MNAPSPQTVKPGKLRNHLLSGTSGSVSSQRASRTIWSGEMFRCRIRARRWVRSGGGSLWRRILGLRLAAVESAHDLLLQPVGLGGVFRLHHSLG